MATARQNRDQMEAEGCSPSALDNAVRSERKVWFAAKVECWHNGEWRNGAYEKWATALVLCVV